MGNVRHRTDSKAQMAGKNSKPGVQTSSRTKKTGGGPAAGSGIGFQAVATAIVAVHILRGTVLGWLKGICSDQPVAVWAESEGPGDDLRIELANDSVIEAQAKKGLSRDTRLWTALLSMADAIHKDHLPYGVLVVASDSSITIRKDLAKDIVRLGQGRTDMLTEIGAEWVDQLRKANLPVDEVCRCLRIKVIHADPADDSDINAAIEVLRSICARENDAHVAWNTLCQQAVTLIEKRGRWTLRDLVRLLRSTNIAIRGDDFPASVLDRQTSWVSASNDHFSIAGIRCKLPLEHLLPMQLERMEFKRSESNDALSALEHYHKSNERKPYGEVLDSIWTARFKTKAVVVAGPGLGKSTMIKELANQYALDGYLVLSVALKPIAAGMRQGSIFSDLLLSHGLDGSGISPSQFKKSPCSNWVVLADGLDECGGEHDEVARQINRFVLGHPHARVVVTTRPIGYGTLQLANWDHYRLLPPVTEEGASNLLKLVSAASSMESSGSSVPDITPYQVERATPSDAISSSPQLLGMSASLILRRRALPRTRLDLYSHLMGVFEDAPVQAGPEQVDVHSVLNIVGWILFNNPLITYDQLIDRTATTLAPLMGKPPMAWKQDVRLAVAHWERVGLVEKVFHDGTKLLTFIHKTFCEFVASRFLVSYPQDLLERVVDQPGAQEVINFAVGQGLADELIALYIRRHRSGHLQQLQPALALLGDPEILVSDRRTKELVQASFKSIEDGAADKFSIGLALAGVGEKASNIVETEAAARLESTDTAVKLVAWATAVSCDFTRFNAQTIVASLQELQHCVEPFDVRHAFLRKDHSDRDLLQCIAIGALKAQPDDQARPFAEYVLNDLGLSSFDLRMQVNLILHLRGLEPLPALFPDAKKKREFLHNPWTVIASKYKQKWLLVYGSIARAFASEGVPTELEPGRRVTFPQFSALLIASGFYNMQLSSFNAWEQIHDESAVQSTLKALAMLIPFDLSALAEEANEILRRINTDTCKPLFGLLPKVDVPTPAWEKAAALGLKHDEVKRALLHPSSWISLIAAQICFCLPMTQEELEMLLGKAEDHALFNVLTLVREHHLDELIPMIERRLSGDATGNLSEIFDFLHGLDIPPSAKLMNSALANLCSDTESIWESAINLLDQWLDQGFSIDRALVSKALEHWGGLGESKRSPFNNAVIPTLQQLLDRMNTMEAAPSVDD